MANKKHNGDGQEPVKRGRGRPTDAKKAEHLMIRISPEEKKLIEDGARHDGMPVSEWVRMVCLSEAERLRRLNER